MARAVYAGASEHEKAQGTLTVLLISANDTHITIIANEVLDAACIAWGSSVLNNEILPTIARAMTYIKGLRPLNRSGLTFGSYGWGPVALTNMNKVSLAVFSCVHKQVVVDMGIKTIREPIVTRFTPDDHTLSMCYDAGHALAEVALHK